MRESAAQYITIFRNIFHRRQILTLLVLATIQSAISSVLVNVLSWITYQIIKLTDLPYITFTNVIEVIKRPILLVWLIIAFVLYSAIVTFFIFFMTLGIKKIINLEEIRVFALIREVSSSIRHTSIFSFIGIFILSLITGPFSFLGINNPLLSRIKIPTFILQDLLGKYAVLTLVLTISWLILFYFVLRGIYVLPNIVIKKQKVFVAIKNSFAQTKNKTRTIFFRIVSPNILIIGFQYLLIAIFYFSQVQIDKLFPSLPAEISAIIFSIILYVVFYLGTTLQTLISFGIMLMPFLDQDILDGKKILTAQERKSISLRKRWTFPILFLQFFTMIWIGFAYIAASPEHNIDYVSHRGVDETSDVQNTIPTLLSTAKDVKPNYVEMDVRWTKDHQWVVMHDGNTKALTGEDHVVSQTDASVLTNLTVKNGSKQEPLALFDDYLKNAQANNQKLLIEIKYDGNIDPEEQVTDFLNKYKKAIEDNGYIMHSLNLSVVNDVKKIAPEIKIGLILPFNLTGNPVTTADFFTIEYSTMSSDFINDVHENGKTVYAWTIDAGADAINVYNQGADGLISDDVSVVRRAIDNSHDGTFAQRLIAYAFLMQTSGR